jgi:hypothetical protein
MYPYQMDGMADFGNILKKSGENINNEFKKIEITVVGKKRSLEMKNNWIAEKKLKIKDDKETLEMSENLNKRLKIT